MKRLILGVLILTLSLTACAGSAKDLTGVTWKLVSYGPPGEELSAVPDVPTSLVFGKDGNVSGNMGCNSFGGDYKVKGDQITFGPMVSTMMACADPIMNQESGVLGILTGTVTYKLEGGQLLITAADGSLATFTK